MMPSGSSDWQPVMLCVFGQWSHMLHHLCWASVRPVLAVAGGITP
jgi:hypothetical protein